MSPIETHLVETMSRDLAGAGIVAAEVTVLSATAGDWRYRIVAADRVFEFGFNPREQLWCRELTTGSERHLISNDHPPIGTSAAARATAIRLLQRAILGPHFPPRDPPVI